MTFVPPPMDRDLSSARGSSREERVAGAYRRPVLGAALLAAVLAFVKRRRR